MQGLVSCCLCEIIKGSDIYPEIHFPLCKLCVNYHLSGNYYNYIIINEKWQYQWVKIQYHMEGYIIIIIYSEACNLQYQYMIVCNWGAWCMGVGEGSNGEHFSAIEGPGPGSVCVWVGGRCRNISLP